MTRWLFAAGLILPGGPLLLLGAAVLWLCRCRHRHTIWRRNASGAMGTECLACGRWRAAWVLKPSGIPKPRLTAPALPGLPSGDPIRELERAARKGFLSDLAKGAK